MRARSPRRPPARRRAKTSAASGSAAASRRVSRNPRRPTHSPSPSSRTPKLATLGGRARPASSSRLGKLRSRPSGKPRRGPAEQVEGPVVGAGVERVDHELRGRARGRGGAGSRPRLTNLTRCAPRSPPVDSARKSQGQASGSTARRLLQQDGALEVPRDAIEQRERAAPRRERRPRRGLRWRGPR